MEKFFPKNTITLWRGVKIQIIFKTQKMLFTENTKTNMGHFHSMFFSCLLQLKFFFLHNILRLRNRIGNINSLFGSMRRPTETQAAKIIHNVGQDSWSKAGIASELPYFYWWYGSGSITIIFVFENAKIWCRRCKGRKLFKMSIYGQFTI